SRTGGPSQRTEVRGRRCQTRRAKKSEIRGRLRSPRTMSNVQWYKQRKNQAAAAALARSLAFHSARKSFISALTLTIRDPTPLYFLLTPVTVLVTAPWLTRLCSFS